MRMCQKTFFKTTPIPQIFVVWVSFILSMFDTLLIL